ncbi:uncharacterized protein BDR25DRAFT_324581 [Lindgomyces ingoldianus]|uniref:Uncharacterized protein n=1 Tax=Lindgomyces ingoldianus TaxID=673940 RepID=A0ACB6QZW4_9PLEO|nr:uncharacterized protein BDR25DRAFT_324581 [Lindgomyces ingoldianus]KAF2472075.1 hypothetical protein BDR25DRAFT_324581 [Lindgomyces ingoldianus]
MKWDMIQRVIDGGKHDWVWWIDFDTLFTNTTTRVEDIIHDSLSNVTAPEEIDVLLTDDWCVLSSSSDRDESMRDYLKLEGPLTKHAMRISQYKINAFPEEILCNDNLSKSWQKAMFVIHFAGAWAHVKEKDPTGFLMRKYEREIIWDTK